MSSYQVSLDVYEGPMDVLLRLIERAELDITLVSLALVTDGFLAHVAQLREVSAASLADFLVIAARLVVIKSRVLLPQPEEPTDEEGEENWEEDLAERLREYKRFKEAAAQLRALEEAGLRCYPRMAPPPQVEPRLRPGEASLAELLEALRRVLAAHPPLAPVDAVVAPVVLRIGECIERIQTLLRSHGRLPFSTVVQGAGSRLEIIVTFLALLELIKRQRVRAIQEVTFGEIALERVPGAPDGPLEALDLSEYGEEQVSV